MIRASLGGHVLVCHCYRVTLDDLRTALARGPIEFEGLRSRLGVGAGCGGCRDYATALLEHLLDAQTDSHESDSTAT